MFNNMKSKIREKTGTDIPKFVPNSKLSLSSSRQGSETSLNSLSCPITDVNSNSSSIIQKTSDFREIDESSYNEWLKKEEDFQRILLDKENEWKRKEQEYIKEMETKKRELSESLKQVEEYKSKIVRYQEDKDQLEQYQLQEMSKIKHLLLAKEKESSENAAALKENLALVESLKNEVTRLRPLEEQISNYEDDIECLRHTSERERWTLSSKLAQSEETVRHLRDRVEVLMKRTEVTENGDGSVEETVQALREERALLERRLEEAHIHLADIKSSWSSKIASLETQLERLSRQAGEEGAERRKSDNLISQLEKKIKDFELTNESLNLKLERIKIERDSLATELKTLTAETSSTESDTTTKYQEVVRELEDLKNKFEDSEIQSSHTNEQLKIDVQSLMRSLEDEKLKVKELEQSLEEERRQRDEAFLRNAQMSQQIQIAQCDLRNTQQENDDLLAQLSQIELASKSKTSDVEKLKEELNELRSQVNGTKLSDLETELSEKNKTIRMLQQRLSDMKKTLQQELRNHTSDPRSSPNETRNNTSDPRSSPNESRNNTSGEDTPPVQPVSSRSNSLEDDVNFKYLKHVIIKFLTCREYEAQHLTRAVAVLLRLSAEEEQQLRDTLDMRNSWWPSRSRILPR
ncbi:hypothetical protein M8J77_009888 [Diaphorina citri]|nr:hypothetical protein M8J77_009888 [Diaphorina citri]